MELSDATEKIPSVTTGIDPGTFRLVAQCFNHYATPCPYVLCTSIGEIFCPHVIKDILTVYIFVEQVKVW
jgi:hypothetical protein